MHLIVYKPIYTVIKLRIAATIFSGLNGCGQFLLNPNVYISKQTPKNDPIYHLILIFNTIYTLIIYKNVYIL